MLFLIQLLVFSKNLPYFSKTWLYGFAFFQLKKSLGAHDHRANE
jgi:hypothetical protein